jgi:flagellar hook-associated protein 2
MGTVSTLPTPFTGVSSFASDLQKVITRAVNIASMPLELQQNQLTDLQTQSYALSGLDQDFAALQSALQNLQTALGAGSYVASSSSPTFVAASAAAGALEAAYTIDVSNLGAYTTALSDPAFPVSDPTTSSISTSGHYTLTVNGSPFDIQPAGGSLMSLAQAINASSAGAHASIVNTGSASTPNYRLVLRTIDLGPATIQLNDGQQDLLGAPTAGSLASYSINGLPAIQTTSRTAILAPGVTINLLQQTPADHPVTVTVSRNLNSAASALSNLASAYNGVVDDLNSQVGPSAGSLSGRSILGTLRTALRQMTQYTSASGAVFTIAQLGLDLDQTGKLSFNSSKFNSQSVDALEAFLGDGQTSGFLKTANDAIDSVEDPIDGSLKNEEDQTTKSIKRQNTLLTQTQQKITDLQNNLTQQMAAADTLLASLENQKNYFNNLFIAMMNESMLGISSVKSNG